MDRVNRWAEGKPRGIVILSRAVALAAEYSFEVSQALQMPYLKYLEPVGKRELFQWFNLYCDHNDFQFWLLQSLGMRVDRCIEAIQAVKTLSHISSMTPAELKCCLQKFSESDLQLAYRRGLRMSRWVSTRQAEMLGLQEGPGLFPDTDIDLALNTLPMRFFLRVSFPCMILYGKGHQQLFREATTISGRKSLECLGRLDKAFLSHPKLRSFLSRVPRSIQEPFYASMSKAYKLRPVKVTRKTIKNRLGRLLFDLSARIGYNLTNIEIQELFDLVAQNKGGVHRDDDFALAPDSFAKGLQREGQFWSLLK